MTIARRRFALAAGITTLTTITALALSGCTSADPLEQGGSSSDASNDTIVIGSQAYYSNEIIAEIYAQALEADGFEVERNFNIGQRDAYLPSLEDGAIQLLPEYTGNLLQFYDPETDATESEDVYTELQSALPESLAVLDQAPAADQDSYNVTEDFAAEHDLSTLEDLADVNHVVLGGPPELEERPYGPKGLESVYGASVDFSATGDTTVEELLADSIQVANVYSADPRIQTESLVTLEDTKGLFLASQVVPLVNSEIADEIAPTINAVNAELTTEDLVALNVESTEDQRSSADIATDWLSDQGLL
ncbi:ABC transporter substrate-binding protein [Leucobacter sp. GX24907]